MEISGFCARKERRKGEYKNINYLLHPRCQMRDVLFEFLAYRSPHRHDQSLMDGARKVRNLFYLLTPAEPGLGDGY